MKEMTDKKCTWLIPGDNHTETNHCTLPTLSWTSQSQRQHVFFVFLLLLLSLCNFIFHSVSLNPDFFHSLSWTFNPINKHSSADRIKTAAAGEREKNKKMTDLKPQKKRERERGVIIQKQCDRTRALCVNDSESSRLTDEEKKKIIFCLCAAGSEVTQISGRHHHPAQKKKQQQRDTLNRDDQTSEATIKSNWGETFVMFSLHLINQDRTSLIRSNINKYWSEWRCSLDWRHSYRI